MKPHQVPPVAAAPLTAESEPRLADYASFLTLLNARGDVSFITYDDFDWRDDNDYQNSYPEEWARWRERQRRIPPRHRKVEVLLQHDTDSGPKETLAMMRLEEAFGAVSSVMTFARRPLKIGEAPVEDYAIDWDALREFQQKGFVVGYHCNAYQVTHFQRDRVAQEFSADLERLNTRGLRTDYFTVHGGKSGPDGASNSSFDYPALTGSPVRWVNTRFSPRFDGYFSDGGSGTAMTGDLRLSKLTAFVAQMRPGCRYRLLIHPQYFRLQDMAAIMSVLPPWPDRGPSTTVGFDDRIRAILGFSVPAIMAAPVLKSPEPLATRLKRRTKDAIRRAFGGTRLYRRVSAWRQDRARRKAGGPAARR